MQARKLMRAGYRGLAVLALKWYKLVIVDVLWTGVILSRSKGRVTSRAFTTNSSLILASRAFLLSEERLWLGSDNFVIGLSGATGLQRNASMTKAVGFISIQA